MNMEKKEYTYTTNVGDYVVIWITGNAVKYIAEITQEEPLQMKVQETGPFAYLKAGDFIVLTYETSQIQESQDACDTLLKEYKDKGHPLISGLASLGIKDDNLYEMLTQE